MVFKPLARRMWRLRSLLAIAFLLGIANGVPAAVIPNLQSDAFGNNFFAMIGGMSGSQAFAAALYTPVVGALSDMHHFGRRPFLVASLALSCLSFLLMAITANVWVYSILDCILGLYNLSLALMTMVVCDVSDPSERSEGFAVLLGWFFLGMRGASFAGPYINDNHLFGVAAGAQISAALVAFAFVPKTSGGVGTSTLNASATSATKTTTRRRRMLRGQRVAARADNIHVTSGTDSSSEGTSPNQHNGNQPVLRAQRKAVKADNIHVTSGTDSSSEGTSPNQHNGNQPVLRAQTGLSLNNWMEHIIVFLREQRDMPALLGAISLVTFLNHLNQELIDGTLMPYLSMPPLNFTSVQQNGVIGSLGLAGIVCLFGGMEVAGKLGRRWLSSVTAPAITSKNINESGLLAPLHNASDDDTWTSRDKTAIVAIDGGAKNTTVFGASKDTTASVASLWVLRAALLANGAMSILYMFVTEPWQAYVLPVFSIVGMGVYPAVCAVAAAAFDPAYVGIVLAVITVMRMIARVVSPVAFGFYMQATGPWMGTAFVVGGGLCLLAMLTTFAIRPRARVH